MQLYTVGYDLNASDLITGLSRGIFMIGDETGQHPGRRALNDVIQAGGGADVIRGGGGGDALWGGAGADVFKYWPPPTAAPRATTASSTSSRASTSWT
jgi:hypothetical protein